MALGGFATVDLRCLRFISVATCTPNYFDKSFFRLTQMDQTSPCTCVHSWVSFSKTGERQE
jgi:hypothetical protein